MGDVQHKESIVRALIRSCSREGFLPKKVRDEEAATTTPTGADMMAEVFAVDEAVIEFGNGRSELWFHLILLNDGIEIISDYGTNPVSDRIIENLTKRFDR